MVKKFISILMMIFTAAAPLAAKKDAGLAELTSGQAVNSIFLSVESAFAFDLYYRQTVGLSLMLFSAGVVTPQIASKSHDIDGAYSRNINAASFWGAATGVMLGLSIDSSDMRTQAYTGMAFDIVATGTAAYYGSEKCFSPEAVSVINSGGIWGTLGGYAVFEIIDIDIRYAPMFMLTGELAGLYGGFLAAKYNNIGFARMAAIDLYAVFGTGAGYGIAYMITTNKRARWICAVAGMISGAAAGYYTTENWRKPSGDYTVSRAPSDRNMYFNIPLAVF